jgi:filamentous hemagglutinin family protein
MAGAAQAQVTTEILALPPGSTSFGDAVPVVGDASGVYTIDEPTFGDRAGANLFFSFDHFDVGVGDTAFFTGNPADFVVSRVGGGDPSLVMGSIGSAIAGAQHIFVNPFGLVFGSESSIDVGGSFHATTADFVRLGDPQTGPVWNALDCCSPLVTSAPPVAFGFSRPDPGSIHIDGPEPDSLIGTVPAGQTFSAIGGDVTVTGRGSGQRTLVARGGEIQLAAVRGSGDGSAVEVPLDLSDFDVDGVAPDQLGSVRIEQAAFLETTNFRTGEPTIGRVVIRGGSLEVLGSAGFTSVIDSGGAGVDPSPDAAIDVRVAGAVTLDGAQLFASPFESGVGGDLSLEGSVLEANDSTVAIRNRADGVPGTLSLDFDQIRLTGATDIGSLAEGSATGADVLVRADRVVAEGSGSFGALFTQAGRRGVQGGDLVLEVRDLKVRSGARIGSSTTSTGNAGNVEIRGAESVAVIGGGQGTAEISARATTPGGGGSAGDITIETDSLRVEDGGLVTATSTGGSGGGTIEIDARDVLVRGSDPTNSANRSAIIALSQSGGGAAGAVSIDAGGQVTVTDDGIVSVSSADVSAGPSGDIEIQTGHLTLGPGGSITTEAFSSQPNAGGDVRIAAAGLVSVQHGEIRTNTPFSSAGNVSIQADTIVLEGVGPSGGTIVASAAGTGGNIALNAKGFFVQGSALERTGIPGQFVSLDGGDIDSLLDATSRLGVAGNIDVTAPDAALAGQLVALSDAFYDREDLLTNRCEARRASVGSLVVRGRDRVPGPPDEDLRIFYSTE